MRQRRGAGRVWLALLAAVALSAVACTGGDGDNGAGEDGGEPAAIDDGLLRLAVADDIELDPSLANPADPAALVVADLLHDGLTRVDDEGELGPALARSWRNNGDFTAFAFVLDEDRAFSDGEPLVAADVVAALEHVASAGDTSLAATRLEPIKGYRAFVDGEAERFSGITAPDATTVRIELTAPVSTLPALLSSPLFGVADPEALEGDEPRTTGPFAIDAQSDDGLDLTRREDVDSEVEEIAVRSYDDDEAAYEAFAAGDADWALVPPSRHDEAVEAYGDEAFRPFHAELFFGMNVGHPKLKGGALRQAIALAIDREAIVEEVFAGVADPLATVVPRGVPGRDADACGNVCEPDPDRAEELLDEAFPDGGIPPIGLDYDDSPGQQEMAEMVKDQLAVAGIRVALRPQPFDEYQRFVVTGKQELFSFGWIGLYPSPDAYVTPLFRGGSPDNVTAVSSGAIDRSLAIARKADPGRVDAQWAAAEKRVLEAAVVVPIAQFRLQVVLSDRVEALEHSVDGTFDIGAVTLAG